ncbi:MAG: SH3 domain-containing protein [Streptosporangiaceae bacterium]
MPSARRWLVRAGAAISAVGIALALAGSAAAAVPAAKPAQRTLLTLFANVRAYVTPSMRAGVQGTLGPSGTAVTVLCWTSGFEYKEIPIWYQVSAPVAGYVAAFNMTAHFAPAAHIPHCATPVFHRDFSALAADLRIRQGPSTTAAIAGYLHSVGSVVKIACFVRGTPVFGDPIWYQTTAPSAGYITGRFLNTGGDPAPGIPRC